MDTVHEEELERFLRKARHIEHCLGILEKAPLPPELAGDVSGIHTKYHLVRNFVVPHLQKKVGYEFRHPNLFLILFLYQEIASMFHEVRNLEHHERENLGLPEDMVAGMLQVKDDMLSLAHAGERALGAGTGAGYRPAGDAPAVPEQRVTDAGKKFITARSNQAILWNFLNPGLGRSSPASPDSKKMKSSQFEALFGIIYLEEGPGAVESAVLTLKNNFEKNQEILS